LVVAYDKGEYDPWTDPLPKRQGSGELRLRGALDEYLAHKRKLGERDQQGGWNAQTHRRYRSNLHAFARQTGERRRVTDLTTEDFESWIFRTSLSEATQRMYRRQLNTFVRWLREKKEVEVADLPKPFRAERRTIDDFPTEEDLRAVCRAHRQNCIEKAHKKHAPRTGPKSGLRRWRYTMAFRLAFYQGLRRKEVAQVKPATVDLARERLAVGDMNFIPKGRHQEVIPIMPPVLPILRSLVEAADGPRQPLFGLKRGRRLGDAFRDARRRALPDRGDLNFQSMRKGAAVFWLEAGLSVRDVQNLLRHQSSRVTKEYYDQYVAEGLHDRAKEAWRRLRGDA